MNRQNGHKTLFAGLRQWFWRHTAGGKHQQGLKIKLIEQPTERTTAATDAALAVLASGCSIGLLNMHQRNPWKAALWSVTFGTLALGAALGAVAHGFEMSERTYRVLWRPLNLLLGTTIALFTTGVVYDLWGEQAARRVLPLALMSAGGFFAYTLVRPGSYLVFVLYQSVGMFFALGSYSYLTWQRRLCGAELMAAGVLTTMVAGGLQASERVSFTLIWKFDHNGVYHLVQMGGMLLLYGGLYRALETTNDR